MARAGKPTTSSTPTKERAPRGTRIVARAFMSALEETGDPKAVARAALAEIRAQLKARAERSRGKSGSFAKGPVAAKAKTTRRSPRRKSFEQKNQRPPNETGGADQM